MSYNHRMYSIPKQRVAEIENLTYEELERIFDNTDGSLLHKIPDEQVYNFGELEYEMSERIYFQGKPLFKRNEVMQDLKEYEPYIVGKEGLLESIQLFRERVIKVYSGLLNDDDTEEELTPKTAQEKQEQHIKDMLYEWQRGIAFNTSNTHSTITHSYKYEYAVFELVHILKTFDFENNTLLFYGW